MLLNKQVDSRFDYCEHLYEIGDRSGILFSARTDTTEDTVKEITVAAAAVVAAAATVIAFTILSVVKVSAFQRDIA